MSNPVLTLTSLEREAIADLEFMACELSLLARQAKQDGTLNGYAAMRRRLTDINTCHMVIARRPLQIAQTNQTTNWFRNEHEGGAIT